MSKDYGFKLGSSERKALDQALQLVSKEARRLFHSQYRNFTNASAHRMRWVQENAETNEHARAIWTAFVKERLK